MSIGTVQHRNVRIAQVKTVALLGDGIGYTFALFGIGHGFDHLDLLPGAFARPDFFLNLFFVEADHFIGSLHDMLGGAVVFFQFKNFDAERVKIFLKVEDVLDGRAAEGIDTLGVIPDHTNVAGAALKMHQLADDAVLQGIGILKLVYQQVAEALAVFV